MKAHSGCPLALTLAVAAVLSGQSAKAQDYFRHLGTSGPGAAFGTPSASDHVFTSASPHGLRPLLPSEEDFEDSTYNIAIGNLRLAMAMGMGVEFNDNVGLSDDNRLSDLILRPSLNVQMAYKFSELNTLRLGFGLSYAKYLDHEEFDTGGLLLSPDSELKFSFLLGPVKFTVSDKLSYQEEPYTVAQVSNNGNYRRWQNDASITAEMPITENLEVAAGFVHGNIWTRDTEFAGEDQSVETIFFRPGWKMNPATKIGMNASYSWIDYKEDFRADANSFMVGPFVEIELTQAINLYAEVGWQDIKHDGTSSYDGAFLNDIAPEDRVLFADNEDSSSWYVKLELNHQATENFIHRIAATKTSEVGFVSNYYDLYNVEYSAAWRFSEKTEFSPSVFWQHYASSGEFGEKAERFGVQLSLRHFFSESLTLGLDYRFLYKDSNIANADYYQNSLFLSLYYKF